MASQDDFILTETATSNNLLAIAKTGVIDVALLHWTMADFDGLNSCVGLRHCAKTVTLPIIMLSDWSGDAATKKAFDAGADGHMVIPFSSKELAVRIRKAHIRPSPSKIGSFLIFRDIVLDLDRWKVFRAGHLVPLNPAEFKLMRELMQMPRRLLSKAELADRICDDPGKCDPDCIKTYAARLRRALSRIGPGHPIRAVRGQGYVLDDEIDILPNVG